MLLRRPRLSVFARRALCIAVAAALYGEYGMVFAADGPSAPQQPGLASGDTGGKAESAPRDATGDFDLHLKLQRNLLLQWKTSKEERPGFLSADHIEGHANEETIAEGNAELRRATQVMTADWMRYTAGDDSVLAKGNVVLTRINGDTITGPEMQLKLDTHVGYFDVPQYTLGKYLAHGSSRKLDFKGEDHYFLTLASFTTCPAGKEAWVMKAADLDIDYTKDLGIVHDAEVIFMGVPLLYTPWADFSLSNKRKSGFLSPTFGTTGKSGFEALTPYYWNIAPNMDATFSPREMTKRGVQLISEFRYLEEKFRGEAHFEYLPYDRITGTERFGASLVHSQNFGNGFTGSLNVNKVSDDTYFQDLSTRIALTSQANLIRDGSLYYGGGWWSGLARVQSFQTLQDPLAPIVPPYRRTPQLTASGVRATPYGDFSFLAEYVNFGHPTLVGGSRTTLYPSIAFPLNTAFAYITPKIGYHFVEYDLRSGPNNPGTSNNDYAIQMPIASLDAGMTFERDLKFRDMSFTQTLEPRLFYLRVPYRNQSGVPNFDTAIADVNIVQLFSENSYVGGDRVSDANQLTAAVTSRLIQSDNGQERVRATLGERFYFEQQRVALDAVTPTRTARNADLVAAVTGHITDKILIDTAIQYDPHDGRTENSGITLRYLAGPDKVLNLGYQYNRDVLQQIDISAQWPIGGNFYVVGRYNYSIQDNRVLEALGGVEYNGGCWVARFVAQRYELATESASSAVFIQLELNGLSRIGSNPLEQLKRNIPGYSRINQPITADRGFSLYE
jgi:LPS-assembly protein